MTTATVHVILLFCAQAKYELGILPQLRSHDKSQQQN